MSEKLPTDDVTWEFYLFPFVFFYISFLEFIFIKSVIQMYKADIY